MQAQNLKLIHYIFVVAIPSSSVIFNLKSQPPPPLNTFRSSMWSKSKTQKKTGVAALITDPPPTSFTTLRLPITSHLTPDNLHLTFDTRQKGGGERCLKISGPYFLGFGREGILKVFSQRMNQ